MEDSCSLCLGTAAIFSKINEVPGFCLFVERWITNFSGKDYNIRRKLSAWAKETMYLMSHALTLPDILHLFISNEYF